MTSVGMHIGRYELLRLLSAGGMGEVYLARQTSSVEGFATLAAIKVLLPNLSTNAAFVQMFLEEARVVGRLHHKNIVQIRDIAEQDGQYYMVMEYIAGQTLRELLGDATIGDRPLFGPRLGCQIFADLASALGAAHAAGLVHRDISPNNIMISDEGMPKLIDFGVARALGSVSLTTPGTLKGKFGYMAPEYVRSQPYDARVDLFSLGVVMWETFARRRLFRGTAAAELLHQLLEGEIPRLDEVNPAIPADLATLVQAALERDPARRLASAAVLADALSELAETLPLDADPTLRRWLERRIPRRLEDRKQTDQALMSLPVGAPIPDFGPAVRADSASIPGTFGAARAPDRSGQRSFVHQAPLAAPNNHLSGTSVGMAAGQLAGAPDGAGSRTAHPRNRGVVLGAFGAALAVVALGMVLWRGNGDRTAAPPVAAVEAREPAASNAERSLAEAHRQIGLKAMADGDYARARSEYAEALRAGGEGDLVELMRLATELERKELDRAKAAELAAAPEVARPEVVDLAPAAAPEPTAKAAPVRAAEPAAITAVRTAVPRGRTEPKPSVPPAAAATSPRSEAGAPRGAEPPPAPTQGDLVVTSLVPKAVVLVDGTTVGQTPLRVGLPVGEHRVVIKGGSEELEARTIAIVGGETARVHVEKQPAPVAPARQAAPPPAPVKPPAPVVVPTPRVTSTGSAELGEGVVQACNACHSKAGARAVASRRYTRAQWDRFFATGQHDRYVPIGNQMNAAQLAAAKAFLHSKAADAPENQGAGMREQ